MTCKKPFATFAALLCLPLLSSVASANGPRTPVEAWFSASGKKMPRGQLIVSPMQRKRFKKFDPRSLRLKGRTRDLDKHLETLVSGQSRQPMPRDVTREMNATSTSKHKTQTNKKHAPSDKSGSNALVVLDGAKQDDAKAKAKTQGAKSEGQPKPARKPYKGFFSRLLFDVLGI